MMDESRPVISRENSRPRLIASREGNRVSLTNSRDGSQSGRKGAVAAKSKRNMNLPLQDSGSRENTFTNRPSRKSVQRQGSKLSVTRGTNDITPLSNQQTRGTRRKGSVATKNFEEELKKTMPKGWNIREGFQPIVYFRKVVKFVIVFTKWIKALREEAEKTGGGGSEAITGLATQDFASSMVTADGNAFDAKEYQYKKEILLSADVREILNQHPTLRTKEQVQLAKYGLQHVQSFSEYPLHMQEKLATVAYFQEVDAKRVIIREGHQAENFYFILSGSAMVTTLIKDEDVGSVEVKFEKYLTKGDSFGEMELLHHSTRQSTVVSRNPMTLLCVGRDNFFNIFMSSQGENTLPDHMKFLSTLEVIKGFPMQALLENPEKCLLHFFRRGSVIVQDSEASDWIYFIKSGTCQVLKQLKGLQPHQIEKQKRKSLPASKLPTDFSLSLPRLGTGAQPSKVNSGLKCLLPPKPKTPRQKTFQKRNETPTLPSSNFLEGDFLSKQDDHLPLLMMEKKLVEDKEFSNIYKQEMLRLDLPIEQTTPHKVSERNTKLNVGYTKSKYNNLTVIKNRKPQLRMLSPPPYAAELNRKLKVKFVDEADGEKSGKDETSSTKSPPVDGSSIPRSTSVSLKDASLASTRQHQIKKDKEAAPVYVQVDLLKPRDAFGLSNIKFDEFMENKSLDVSLVSRGAECIMVEKEFFVTHAPQEVKHSVMSLVRPYPAIEVLQGNLEIKAGWDNYKQGVLRLSQENVAERKNAYKALTLLG